MNFALSAGFAIYLVKYAQSLSFFSDLTADLCQFEEFVANFEDYQIVG
jgi:hypothetical protein